MVAWENVCMENYIYGRIITRQYTLKVTIYNVNSNCSTRFYLIPK